MTTKLTPSDNLFTFNGGIPFDVHGTDALSQPLSTMPVPKRLVLPLQQHIGQAAEPNVKPGDKVLKGQVIANASSYVSAPVHAPSSGTVVSIEEQSVAHPSGLQALCITIDTDGKDTWIERDTSHADYLKFDGVTLRNLVRDAGIVGLGGAAFPSAIKLNPGQDRPIETLLINGAECEPYICCDEKLMTERAEEVIKGIQIVRHIIGASKVIIAIEDSMPTAFEGLNKAIADAQEDFDVKIVPTVYPTGGEKQLIKVITGLEVPSNGLPSELGIVCHNPGTVAAVYHAIVHGQPLVSRILTVTGEGVEQAQNIEALLGTSVKDIVDYCGGYKSDVERLIMGGPMMGFALHSDNLPIVKATNCILVGQTSEIHQPSNPQPCIRCGMCEQACPANLLPQQLYWHAKNKDFEKAKDYNLFDCIECGACSYVCPSEIPLVQFYRFTKTEIAKETRERKKSDIARDRFDFRQERIEREKEEKAEKLRKKKEALAAKKAAAEKAAAASSDGDDDATKADAKAPVKQTNPEIAAALARVEAKKAAKKDEGK